MEQNILSQTEESTGFAVEGLSQRLEEGAAAAQGMFRRVMERAQQQEETPDRAREELWEEAKAQGRVARKAPAVRPEEKGAPKRCRRCGQDKPRSAFYARKESPDGLENTCKACRDQVKRENEEHAQAARSLNFNLLAEVAEVQEIRQRAYGNPVVFFEAMAKQASLMMREEVSAADCVKILMALKLTREIFHPSHDHRLDLVGYTAILDQLEGR